MKRVRLQQVRLTDIPFERRMAAARREAREAASEEERTDLFAAAMFPSNKAYFVRVDGEEIRAAA